MAELTRRLAIALAEGRGIETGGAFVTDHNDNIHTGVSHRMALYPSSLSLQIVDGV